MEKVEKENYCSQNNNHCETCSLVNYNRDCHNNVVHVHTCGHRATFSRELTKIFGKPNYKELEKIDCYDCRNK